MRVALAARRAVDDIGGGRLAVDVSLANPVRSGRKQPQRVSTRVVRQPLTIGFRDMASKKDKGSDNAAPAADALEPSLGLSGGSSKSDEIGRAHV